MTEVKRRRVFIDTEFSSLAYQDDPSPYALPELLSVGIVKDSGDEFYGEIYVDETLRKRCSEFVVHRVLPQFGRAGEVHSTIFSLSMRVNDFLFSEDRERVEVVHDNSIDWKLLVRLAILADPSARAHMRKRNVWKELREASKGPSEISSSKVGLCGLDKHHSLFDARALKMKCALFMD